MEQATIALGSGRYQLFEPLGAGGMATVRRAWDTRLQVWRAIKMLRTDVAASATVRRRFDQEARAMARLHHPHILAVHDVGDDGGLPFLVMALATGGSLADVVAARGPLAPALACRLVEEVLLALQHAHDHGVVHRDVKPHNVLLDGGRALVSDFGIARVIDTDSGLTRTGAMVGTLAYMAPEQRSSAATVDGRADVYAAAATLYHLLTAKEPLDLYVERPGCFDGVEPALADIVRRGTRYAADERYPSAGEMAAAVAGLRPSLGVEPSLPEVAPPRAAPSGRSDSDTFTDSFATEPVAAEPIVTPPQRQEVPIVPWGAASLGAVALIWAGWSAWSVEVPTEWVEADALIWLPEGADLLGIDDGTVAWAEGDIAWTAGFEGAGRQSHGEGRWWWSGGRLWKGDDQGERIVLTSGDETRIFDLPDRSVGLGVYPSPDARRVLYPGQEGLYAASPGEPTVRLAGGDDIYTTAWSPDGGRIAAIVDTGRANAARIAILQVDPPSVRYLLDDYALVLHGGRAAVAWRGDDELVYLRRSEAGVSMWAVGLEGEPRELAALGSDAVDLEVVGDAVYSGHESAWTGVQVLDLASGAVVASHREGRWLDLVGWYGSEVLLHHEGSATAWSPDTDAVRALGGQAAGQVGDDLVTWEAEAVHIGSRTVPAKVDELRCADGACWARQGTSLVAFDLESGAMDGARFAWDQTYTPGWSPSPEGLLMAGRDGLQMQSGDKLRTFGTFGLDFLQSVYADRGGAYVTGWRQGTWEIGFWSASEGYAALTSNEGAWIGNPRPDGRGRLAIGRLFEEPRRWRSWTERPR